VKILNLSEIAQEVSYLMQGEPVNLATVSKFVNKCMDTLSNRYDTACIKKTATIVCDDVLKEYPLPDDCIGVYKVKDDVHEVTSYLIAQDGISFYHKDTYTIEYYARPELPKRGNTDELIKTDVPPINDNYHKCFAKYIAAELIKIVNPKDGRIEIFTNDFVTESKEVDTRLSRQKRKHRRVKAPIWG
jgi:hypothetical protein